MAFVISFQRPPCNQTARASEGALSTSANVPRVPPAGAAATSGPALSTDITSSVVSAHPDAVRRRQEAARRKAAAQAQVELITKATWWEGASPPNLRMIASPVELRDIIASATCLVVVDFFTSWCTACRRLYPKLKQIAENNPDVCFVKADVGQDSLREMAEGMGVQQLPYFQFYMRGQLVNQFAANLTKVNRLRAEIAASKDCNANDACIVQA